MAEPQVAAYVLTLHKQEPLTGDETIPDFELFVTRPLPRDQPPERMAELYETDAQALARRLWDTLPGGTVDQLLVELMRRRASLFRVGFLPVDQIARLADPPPEPRPVTGISHGYSDHGWPCCAIGKATEHAYTPMASCGGPDVCARCREWRVVYHGGSPGE